MKRVIFFLILCFAFAGGTTLHAQAGESPEKAGEGETPPGAGETGETPEGTGQAGDNGEAGEPNEDGIVSGAPTGLIYYGRREDSRIRFTFGFGRGEVKPGLVSEASPAWFLNSAIRSSVDSTYQPVLPLDPGNKAKYWSLNLGLEYAYKDRLFISYNWYQIDQGLGNENSTTVTFFHPPSTDFRWSYFEGARLARYFEENRTIEAKYLHPVLFPGFKAGAYIAREFYREENDISYGSYQATTASNAIAATTTAWSVAAVVPGNYEMAGWTIGPAFRYQIFQWFGLHYKLGIIERDGSYNQGGFQTLTVSNDVTGATQLEGLFPYATGRAKDTGIRHVLEAVFCVYCRFTITVGFLKEDLSRSYESYAGYTFGTRPNLYSQKTPTGLGIGETSTSHEVSKQEIYLKLGSDFFF